MPCQNYTATVSKSLLIVLGTLPLPEPLGRGKCHNCGDRTLPQLLGQTHKTGLSTLPTAPTTTAALSSGQAARVVQKNTTPLATRYICSYHSASGRTGRTAVRAHAYAPSVRTLCAASRAVIECASLSRA